MLDRINELIEMFLVGLGQALSRLSKEADAHDHAAAGVSCCLRRPLLAACCRSHYLSH